MPRSLRDALPGETKITILPLGFWFVEGRMKAELVSDEFSFRLSILLFLNLVFAHFEGRGWFGAR